MIRRGLAPLSAEILHLDEQKRKEQTKLQEMLAKRNGFAKAIGEAKRTGADTSAIMAESKQLNDEIVKLEGALAGRGALEEMLETIPNLPAADVPEGTDEHGNVEVRVVGKKPSPLLPPPIGGRLGGGLPKAHDELGVNLGLMDFDGAAKLSGARFVVLKGALAKMERALANFMLDIHTNEFGYTEHVPPLLVRETAAYGTGNLPKFAEDLFKTDNGFYLIPTAEMPLTNLVADTIIDAESLPIRMTAYTPCFRSEAGAAGKDTRGMVRQHQFSKVELISVVAADKSEAEHERMTACAEEILKRLGLHYRVMLLCSGDMGFCSQKTYDIEVWLPAQDTFREISSCSNCGAFQARRMKARSKAKGAKETEFVHTLNGSGLAIGRTMVAILENYQQADGSIVIPEALQPYMGGLKVIVA
ncbi:MAG: serine--tRNA ligase [Rickettsiales bacterium]